jgi:hypothetical protein
MSEPGRTLPVGNIPGWSGLCISSLKNTGAYDQEIFLVLKVFGPTLSRGGDMAMDFLAGSEIKSLKDKGEAAMNASL